MDGFQDATTDFDDSSPINIDDDPNLFEFHPEDDVNLSDSEVHGEHHPHVQTIQEEQLNPIVDFGSSAAQELPRLHA